MREIILHHYEFSPFSQKIRSLFGYANMNWFSVNTREWSPRSMLYALAGNYRKVPVAQIGADVFCDTRTITTEIARLVKKQELSLENCDNDVAVFLEKVELDVFVAMIRCSASMKLQKKAFQKLSILEIIRFMWDRVKLSRDFSFEIGGRSEARSLVISHLELLDQRLAESDSLFGSSPNIGDFGAYHSLWFTHEQGKKPILNKYPSILEWLDKIKCFGIGSPFEITPQDALNIAKEATPRSIDISSQKHDLIGERVAITPNDYGRIPVQGSLVGATPTSWIILRNAPEVGAVHVHFPKQGFDIRKLSL